MDKTLLKKIGIYIGIVLFFLILAYGFVPQVLSGKIVNQSDITGYMSMSHEANEWNAAHPDDIAHWTDSMFGGMPTTGFMASNEGDFTHHLYKLLMTGKRPATYLFISLLGAFLLMLSLGMGNLVAIGGAIAVTFCSYNPQIIFVGHNTKMQALAFLPWVLAAVIFTYKSALKNADGWKKWLPSTLLGAVLFGLALSMQIKANHQQITYYLALMIFIFVVTEFIWLVCNKERRKKVGNFFVASVLLLAIGLVGIGTNAIKLAPLYEYTQHTMRGGSELSNPEGGQINNNGLQLDYATSWSYGWEELPNLLIPNYNGGASYGAIPVEKSALAKVYADNGGTNVKQFAESLPLYWGPQPFTAGPMYMGAITIFLFLMGLFLHDGKEKWWMLAATILAICLGVGRHMMWFTKFFFDYVPMYNKFRTVSMALVILQFTLPMLGFLTLDRIMKKEYAKKDVLGSALSALIITAGFCLACIVVPSIAGSFIGDSDGSMSEEILAALRADRIYVLRVDAFWSMMLILATFGLIAWGYKVPKDAEESYESDPHIGDARRIEASVGICLLVLINMFAMGHRYLSGEDFTTPRNFNGHFKQRPVDEFILQDETASYRMVDLTADVFNDNFNPYWHKSIGGYSPAKMQRYQDLITKYITKELKALYVSLGQANSFEEAEANLPAMPIVNALNTKYIIIDPNIRPVINGNVNGNAWLVDSVLDVTTPDEELDSIGKVDLLSTAVIGADYKASSDAAKAAMNAGSPAPADTIFMTSYSPNELQYHYNIASGRTAVFSEVFYPDGWVATVDGDPLDIFRADWVLRAAVLPQGEHDIVMRFEPKVYTLGKTISATSSASLVVLLILAVGGMFIGTKKKDE